MNPVLKKFFASRSICYLVVDRDLVIKEISPGLERFADTTELLQVGEDVRLSFPELYGMEACMQEICQRQRSSFELVGVSRAIQPIDNSEGEDNLSVSIDNIDRDTESQPDQLTADTSRSDRSDRRSSQLPRTEFYMDIFISRFEQEELNRSGFTNLADNLVDGLIILFEDVSDRMEIEQKLMQSSNEANLLLDALSTSNSYVETILSSMADAMIVTTASGMIKVVNAAAQQLFGYPEAELAGQHISTLIAIAAPMAKIETQSAKQDNQNISPAGAQAQPGQSALHPQPEAPNPIAAEDDQQAFFFPAQNLRQSAFETTCRTKSGKKVVISFLRSTVELEDSFGLGNRQDIIYVGRDITAWQARQQRITIQHEVTRILAESITIEQAAPQLLAAICKHLDWDIGEFWIVERDRSLTNQSNQSRAQTIRRNLRQARVLHCTEMWHSDKIDARDWQQETSHRDFAIGEGLPGKVWAQTNSLWMANLANSKPGNDLSDTANITEISERATIASELGLQCGFGFPIQSSIAVWGVITCFSREVRDPDLDLLQIGANIGNQIGLFIDRKRAEMELRESEERYRDLFESAIDLMFENSSDLIQWVSAEGRLVYVNRAWRNVLGYSETEIAELLFVDVVHPDCRDRYRQLLAGLNVTTTDPANVASEAKLELITSDGSKVFVEGTINCKYADGRLVAIRAIFKDITERLIAEAALRQQKEQTDRLLLNILPATIADRLKQETNIYLANETSVVPQGSVIAESFNAVTVMFADIVNFTEIASTLNPIELVGLLNQIFSSFDRLCEQYGLEKIKTIGDAYMVVGGLPTPSPDHAVAIATMALAIQSQLTQLNQQTKRNLQMRIGIHSGPVVAGVIGLKKFIYDLWGDTVNIASRMESQGIVDKVQVSASTYELLQHHYLFEKRGTINIRGKGNMPTYILLSPKPNNN
ncbi:adenylate/guanylate cyclase [Thalassoporum mexicanum PCC 7367]|uniref:adenylate/guanylate cyclase domain-containing protein n=1 Tax=Thalassoporum mexicanum TaxID=3457544 RepID=UPI00029FD656|nr:adenylate/guanylate cyclase domain-containing protein [Pseudanabaena sp. PCC 7367]AFY68830.1 adenylate/guanylate cyclase [Pseudanabaena sp. PCC 7367]